MNSQLESFADENSSILNLVAQDKSESKNRFSIQLLLWWSERIEPNWIRVRMFIEESLDEGQSKNIALRERLNITEAQLALLKTIVPSDETDRIAERGKGEYEVPQYLVEQLRATAIKYLNHLEAVLTAWNHDVADRSIIEEQFRFSVMGSKQNAILGRFREADGSKHFPNVQRFVDFILGSKEQIAG